MHAVAMPKQVRRQGEQADEALKKAREEASAREGAGTVEAPKQPPEPPQQSQAPDPQQPHAQPAPVTGEIDELRQKLAVAEQRFRTLQGKYNAETQRNADQIRTLSEQVARLTQTPPTPPADAGRKYVTAEDGVVGDEILGASERVARGVAEGIVRPVQEQLAATQAELAESRRRAYLSVLNASCPTWQELNSDERFLEWLDQPDGTSGQTRDQSLKNAHARSDAAHVASIFNAYLTQTSPPAPPSAQLERKVKPLPGQQEPAREPIKGRTFTKGEITRFYDDVAKGRYRERPAEQKQKEAEIDQAVREGRVQG